MAKTTGTDKLQLRDLEPGEMLAEGTLPERPVHLMPPVIPGPDRSPNVIFIGTRRRNGKEERLAEAPQTLINGPSTFYGLPGSAEQLSGFYYKRAAELCRAFPGLYKPITKKGE
jgi:hypothetical protein